MWKFSAVRTQRRVVLPVEVNLKPLAVREDRRMIARPRRRLRAEVPGEVRFDHRPHLRIDLGHVERCAQLRDAEEIGYTRAFHRLPRVQETHVIESAPGTHYADARIRGGSVVRLRMQK